MDIEVRIPDPAGAMLEVFVGDVFAASAAIKQKAAETMSASVVAAARLIAAAFRREGILYTFGNGGSAADAQHMAGEMVGRYYRERGAWPAVALSTDPSTITCIGNDYGYDEIFARQVTALASSRDVVMGISTSGRSRNVLLALEAARRKGARTIVLTGGDGGDCVRLADVAVIAPSNFTPRIQECHITAVHAMCEVLEHVMLGMEMGRQDQVPPKSPPVFEGDKGNTFPPHAHIQWLEFGEAGLNLGLESEAKRHVRYSEVVSLHGARILHSHTHTPVANPGLDHSAPVESTKHDVQFAVGLRVRDVPEIWHISRMAFNYRQSLGAEAGYTAEGNVRAFVKKLCDACPEAHYDDFFLAERDGGTLPAPVNNLLQFLNATV